MVWFWGWGEAFGRDKNGFRGVAFFCFSVTPFCPRGARPLSFTKPMTSRLLLLAALAGCAAGFKVRA